MFENLQDKLERAFKVLKGEGRISEINVAQTMKEVRRALIDADVNYKVAKTFTDTVKEKAIGQKILTSLKPKELMANIVMDELASLMGGEEAPIKLEGKPAIILMAGLNGSGKTTFAAKLAKRLKSKGRNPLLVADDMYRPGAVDQLKTLAEGINIPVYSEPDNNNPVEIAGNSLRYARENHYDVMIVDTAGRLAVDDILMDEIENIKNVLNPDEILFVVDAMTGQDAVNTAKIFNDRLDFDGVVLTKLDGDTRGGAAVSIRSVVNKPIKFVGRGEKMDDIDEFDPRGMASRIMGNGDIVGLAKRAQEIIDEEEARKMQERIEKNKFDFDDFLNQIQKVKKLGNIKDLASMIPGVGKAIRDVDIPEDAFKYIEAIINSMTPYERSNPDKIIGSRRQRIANGSGRSIQEVNRLIKQFEDTRKIMRKTAQMQKNPMKMMQQMRQMKQQMRHR